MVDKNYCMSSYMAFRYIERDDFDFYEGIHHQNLPLVPDNEKTLVSTASDIDNVLEKVFSTIKDKKLGILLSGGMDSANLASYMKGCDAYTFRFLGGEFSKDELERAKYYANYYGLRLHYVDIDWNTVSAHLDDVMKSKAAPVHSIEPQIYQAALQAKTDGIELMVIGDAADYIFGGMDKLLSKDWTYNEFVKRYTYVDPKEVLASPVDMSYTFDKYKLDNGMIDYMGFMAEYADIESYSSYDNAFKAAALPYIDPYVKLKLNGKLDLTRIRNGEPKYLIRELFSMKYPEMPVPNKLPMPRPVDAYFADWEGPTRPEFKKNLDMGKFTGNQKWQMYCLERFLNLYE